MKTILMLFLPILVLSCTGRRESPVPVELATPSTTSFNFHEDSLNCVVSVEAPIDARCALAVGEWLDECLGGIYDGNPADMKALVQFYGQAKTDSLRVAFEEMGPDVEVAFEANMTKTYETELYMTYGLSTYIGLGGVHPLISEQGATFRKSDGRRLGWDIIRSDQGVALNDLIKASLMNYLGVSSEEDMEPYIDGMNIYDLPLPRTSPYMLENGMAFVYQPYELLPYAMGMPADTIPYDKIRPLLTRNMQKLLEQ